VLELQAETRLILLYLVLRWQYLPGYA
jgi:hypothetical protein